jgi:peptidoglycan L-alanyl-D-glutamate endopeptidase CwlK
MPTKLTQTSLKRLEGVHPHLVAVMKLAADLTTVPFQITCGTRSLAAQRKLVKLGVSRTLKSRHIPAPNGLGHAVDVVAYVAGKITWKEAAYHRIADAVKDAARRLGHPVEWGGDWTTFFDGPHFQLPWAQYPGVAAVKDNPPPQPTLRELALLSPGARGEAVMSLQADLNALGQALKVDGDFGPKTRAAVQHVSARFGKPTDVVSAALRDKIASAARKSRAA